MYLLESISQFQNPNGANETAVGVSTVNPRWTGNDVFDFSGELLRIKLFDVSGRLVYNYEGTFQNMMSEIQSKNKILTSSLYILQVFTINGKPIGNHKLMIQK